MRLRPVAVTLRAACGRTLGVEREASPERAEGRSDMPTRDQMEQLANMLRLVQEHYLRQREQGVPYTRMPVRVALDSPEHAPGTAVDTEFDASMPD